MSNEIEFIELDVDNGKDKKNNKKIIIIIVSIIIFILSVMILLYFSLLRPQRIINKIISSLENEIKQTSNSYEYDFSTFVINGDLKVNNSKTSYEILNGLTLNYKLGYDSINKKALADITLKKEQIDLNAKYYLYNDISYIQANNLLPVTTKFNTKKVSEVLFETTDSNNIDELIKVILDSFKTSYNKENMKTKISTKGFILEYKIDEKEYNNIKNKTIDNLLKNDKALKELTQLLNLQSKDITKVLNDKKNKQDKIDDINITILFSKKIKQINITQNKTSITLENNKKDINIVYNDIFKKQNINAIVNLDKNTNLIKSEITIKSKDKTSKADILIENLIEKERIKSKIDIKFLEDIKNNNPLEATININLTKQITFEGISTYKSKYIEEYTEEEMIQLGLVLNLLSELFKI